MHEMKICPLLTEAGSLHLRECLKENCAWYIRYHRVGVSSEICQNPETNPIAILFACVSRVYPNDILFVWWFAVFRGLLCDLDYDLDKCAEQLKCFGNCPIGNSSFP